MPVTLVLGAQVGDEGKGKVIDFLAENADIIVRYAGGANAGHTLVLDGKKHVTHSLPSGVLHKDKKLVLASGMVLDLRSLVREIMTFEKEGLLNRDRLVISNHAHLVLPYHKILDEHREKSQNIGTTKQGIGPAYAAKISRIGVRVADLSNPSRLMPLLKQNWESLDEIYGDAFARPRDLLSPDELIGELLRLGETLAPYITDTREFLKNSLKRGANILLESDQGVMLDTDHGEYPFVTSSPTTSAGALLGTGLSWRDLDRVVGVCKAYTTRIANGPLPTEMPEAEQVKWREHGGEYGATTGRPRRIGWLDLPLLRYAVEVNGLTEVALTRLDTLVGMGPIKVAYNYTDKHGQLVSYWRPGLGTVEPLYETFGPFERAPVVDGQLQPEFQNFLAHIEGNIDTPVKIASYGAGREDTLVR